MRVRRVLRNIDKFSTNHPFVSAFLFYGSAIVLGILSSWWGIAHAR